MSNSSWTIAYYRHIYIIIINLILVILYGFGLYVLHQHSRTGLLIFGWLVTIVDVIATIAVLFIFFVTIFLITPISFYSFEILTGLFLFTIIFIVGMITMVISIKHAFDLSKLIKNNKRLTIEI
ncbi:unnamed protein product [Adineta steineri]|uniref:Uncharacterized protein n=1 Tax=Adineta steineri TaxID=433720 RepID=A0A819RR71_9BILA|nr:unnamed protein product [Adineta steineri]